MASTAATTPATVIGYPVRSLDQIPVGYPTTTTSYRSVASQPATFSQHDDEYGWPVDQNPTNIREKTILSRVGDVIATVFCFILVLYAMITGILMYQKRYPEFQVESAAVSYLNATGSQLTAKWDFTLFVRNPNHRFSILYDRLETSVLYGKNSELSSTILPSFLQGRRNETRLQVQLSVISKYVKEDLSKGISNGRDSGSLSFGMEVLTRIQFRCPVLISKFMILRVYCESLKIGFSSPNNGTGTLLNNPIPCTVHYHEQSC